MKFCTVCACLCNPGAQNTFDGCITSGASTVRPSCSVMIKSPMDYPKNSVSLDIFSALAALRSMQTGSICIDAGMKHLPDIFTKRPTGLTMHI